MSNWSLTHLLTKRKEQACWDLSLTYFLTWRLTRNKNRTSFTYESPVNTSLLTKKTHLFCICLHCSTCGETSAENVHICLPSRTLLQYRKNGVEESTWTWYHHLTCFLAANGNFLLFHLHGQGELNKKKKWRRRNKNPL